MSVRPPVSTARTRRRFALTLGALSLGACSSTVRTPPLVVDERQALQWRSFVAEPLKGQIALGEVKGGDPEAVGYLKKTLAFLWGTPLPGAVLGDALEDQLRALRLLASAAQPGRYQLDTEVLVLSADGWLGPAQAQAQVRYTLKERAEGGRTVYARRIRSAGDAGWLDHALLHQRHRLAKENALRQGLSELAFDLVSLRM